MNGHFSGEFRRRVFDTFCVFFKKIKLFSVKEEFLILQNGYNFLKIEQASLAYFAESEKVFCTIFFFHSGKKQILILQKKFLEKHFIRVFRTVWFSQ